MNNKTLFNTQCGALFAITVALAGCGGGGSSNDPDPTPPVTLSVSGTVTAPGGSVALREPTVLENMLATVLGKSAIAALPGTSAASGVTVSLIEIDTTGAQVGSALATATTASDGTFTVEAPETFTAAGNYVLRVGSGASQMDAIVTGTADQDIDPSTEAATDLILSTVVAAGGSLASLDVGQVDGIKDTVAKLSNDVADAGSIAGIVTALKTEADNQDEVSNAIGSVAADGTITGTVTDASSTALANIDVVVRDFSDWVTRAKTKTNASGQYTVKVPSGSTKHYIVGAINHTSTSTAASEWWTAGGGVANQFSAEKVSVPNTTAVTKDFALDAGAQIKGVVYATDGTTALGGVHVLVRDFSNDMPVAVSRTRPDGKYLINVKPGTYTVGTRNTTLQAYAGVTYNGAAAGSTTAVTGGAGASAATPIVVAAGDVITAKFNLPAGGKVSGVVTDPTPTTTPVTGMSVRFYGANTADDATNGAFVEGVKTNKDGGYRMWVLPGDYEVRARGQIATITADTAVPAAKDFTNAVSRATATLTTDGTTPLSQVKVQVYDSTGANYLGFEASNGDGTVTVYTDSSANYLLELKMDNGSTAVGSAIYDGTTSPVGTLLTSGSPVAFTVDGTTNLGTLTLPSGGELTGLVTKDGIAFGNAKVQVRNGNNGGTRFVTTRTQSDGSYTVSVPAGIYKICAFVESATNPCNTSGGTPTGYFGYSATTATVSVSASQSNTVSTIDMITH